MTTPLTGYDSGFPSDVVIDSGILYLGATKYAALRGGLKFDPGAEYRNIEFDGKRSNVKGLDRKTKVSPKLSATMIELPSSEIDTLEPGVGYSAGGGWSSGDRYTPKKADGLLASGDYLTNVRAVWLRGSGGFVQVIFPSALLVKYSATSQDADELAIDIEIEARLDLGVSGATPGDSPFLIDYLSAAG